MVFTISNKAPLASPGEQFILFFTKFLVSHLKFLIYHRIGNEALIYKSVPMLIGELIYAVYMILIYTCVNNEALTFKSVPTFVINRGKSNIHSSCQY